MLKIEDFFTLKLGSVVKGRIRKVGLKYSFIFYILIHSLTSAHSDV